MECQVKNRKVSHSDPKTAPEMFTVRSNQDSNVAITVCLAHAVIAEGRGHQVDLILT